MILTPIRHVLSAIQHSGTRALLMGGQACVFYGAAQVNKNVNLLVLPDDGNLDRLHEASALLKAVRIAVPPSIPGTRSAGTRCISDAKLLKQMG